MLVGLDIDGVIRDFASQVEKVYKIHYPDHEVKEVKSWGLHNYYPIGKEIYNFVFHEHGDEVFREAPVYKGAIEFAKKLSEEHEIVCVTSQPNFKIINNSMYWLEKNGFTDYITHYVFKGDGDTFSKGHVRIDALIDDYIVNLQAAEDHGVFGIGKWQTWNDGRWYPLFKEYDEILDFLRKLENVKNGKVKIPKGRLLNED